MRLGWRAGLAVVAITARLDAQTVRVTVVTDGERIPIAGAIVSLRSAAGVTVRRGLTNEGGRLVLRAPSGGSYLLRADRIGFRGVDSVPVVVPDTGAVAIELPMPNVPVILAELKVRGSTSCAGDPATSTATADLWSEIRKALDATSLAKRSGLTFVMALWRRELNDELDTKKETVDTVETDVTRPFFASSAEELAAQGYIVPNGKGTTFLGPDEEVLLSPSFLATHCFSLNRRTVKGNLQVGLRFEPTRDRKLPDIAGTLWVDADRRELREVEFLYRNVPRSVPKDGLAGKVEFAVLPEGWWIVNRWNIRMPKVQEVRVMSGSVSPVDLTRRSFLNGYTEDGGGIVSVKRP